MISWEAVAEHRAQVRTTSSFVDPLSFTCFLFLVTVSERWFSEESYQEFAAYFFFQNSSVLFHLITGRNQSGIKKLRESGVEGEGNNNQFLKNTN